MKSLIQVLQHHEIKHDDSCIAWALELVLKINEKIAINEYPLQTGVHPVTGLNFNEWGFGEPERQFIANQYTLDTGEARYDLAAFQAQAELDAKRGNPLVFSFPNKAYFKDGYHAYVPHWDGRQIVYLYRAVKNSGILAKDIVAEYPDCLKAKANYEIHCFRVIP